MASSAQLAARIMEVMSGYQNAGVTSVTSDTLSRVLHISRKDTHATLLLLMKLGRLEYAKKNPRSTQSRYQIKGGATN
jgi:Trk-type K+ transport system membrane component